MSSWRNSVDRGGCQSRAKWWEVTVFSHKSVSSEHRKKDDLRSRIFSLTPAAWPASKHLCKLFFVSITQDSISKM